MHKTIPCLAVSFLSLLLACSDAGSTSTPDAGVADAASEASPSPGGNDGGVSRSDSSAPASPLAGKLGTASFVMKSGFFRRNEEDKLDLVFSNEDGVCASATAGKLHSSEALVQLYHLDATEPGTFELKTADEIKYGVLKAGCSSGATVDDDSVAASGRDATGTITVTKLDTTSAEGTLDLTFSDGSKVKGAFVASACSKGFGDGVVCY